MSSQSPDSRGLPEQFGSADRIDSLRLDSLRKELEGKIENKLATSFFYWSFGGAFGAIIVIGLWLISGIDSKIDSLFDKISLMNDKVIVIETKVEKR